jgi:hypothetical protein
MCVYSELRRHYVKGPIFFTLALTLVSLIAYSSFNTPCGRLYTIHFCVSNCEPFGYEMVKEFLICAIYEMGYSGVCGNYK